MTAHERTALWETCYEQSCQARLHISFAKGAMSMGWAEKVRRDAQTAFHHASLALDAYEALRADDVGSPVLDFHAWLETHTQTFGPLTQDQYLLAQAAFFAAHPGRGPRSSVMEVAENHERKDGAQ